MTFLILSAIFYFLPTILRGTKADFMGIFLVEPARRLDGHRLVIA